MTSALSIYHISNLTPNDRFRIQEADDLIRSALSCRRSAIQLDMDDPFATSMDKAKLEEHLQALQDLWEEYQMCRVEKITAILEGYSEVYLAHQAKARPAEHLGNYWDYD